ncbi:hypothetical protein [Phenylobacterium sp.]|nr:hypothetical protein [Phenylobacterium sp.]
MLVTDTKAVGAKRLLSLSATAMGAMVQILGFAGVGAALRRRAVVVA